MSWTDRQKGGFSFRHYDALEDARACADAEFSEGINVDFTPKDGMVNPFGL